MAKSSATVLLSFMILLFATLYTDGKKCGDGHGSPLQVVQDFCISATTVKVGKSKSQAMSGTFFPLDFQNYKEFDHLNKVYKRECVRK